MSTPAIDFWPHFEAIWFGSAQNGSAHDSIYCAAQVIVTSWGIALENGDDYDPVEELLRRWGDRPRTSSNFLDKAEILRLLRCLKDGHTYASHYYDGLWDHFKGGVYTAHGDVKWTGEEGGNVVIYTSLVNGETYARHVRVWNEIVLWPDGEYRTRFVKRNNPKVPPAFKVPTPDA